MNLFLLLAALVEVPVVISLTKLASSDVDGVAPADSSNTMIIRDLIKLNSPESSERMLMEKAVKILCATRRVFEIVCRADFSSSVHLGAITHIRLFSNLVSSSRNQSAKKVTGDDISRKSA